MMICSRQKEQLSSRAVVVKMPGRWKKEEKLRRDFGRVGLAAAAAVDEQMRTEL